MEALLSNDRQIAMHRNKLDFLEAPPNSLQFGFGDRRFEKMSREMSNYSDTLKLKTLHEINEDFRRSDQITLALMSSNAMPVLLQLYMHKNNDIRELSSRAIKQICMTTLGKTQIMKEKYLEKIIDLINDAVPQIRLNTYDALLNFGEFIDGTEFLMQTNLLEELIDKVVFEKGLKQDDVLIKTLRLIKNLLYSQLGIQRVLKTAGIERFIELLKHQNSEIRDWAAQNLACISYNELGKIQVISENGVIPLCHRLCDDFSTVRESASQALVSLAQLKQGKVQILENDFFNKIMDLLDDVSEEIKLNIIQLIASVSEHPEGREAAKSCLPKLEELASNSKNVFLFPYIKQTISVITWIP